MFQANRRLDKEINKQQITSLVASFPFLTHTPRASIGGKHPTIRKNSINAGRNQQDAKGMLCHESLNLTISCLYLTNVIIYHVSFV